MIGFGTFVLIWPFFAVALAIGIVLLAHRFFDRREQRQHPAE
jgi:hypothetical protein